MRDIRIHKANSAQPNGAAFTEVSGNFTSHGTEPRLCFEVLILLAE